MKLLVHSPTYTDDTVTASYTHSDVTYSHVFTLPASTPSGDSAVKTLIEWLALIHSVYLFSIEYFTDIETEFPLTDNARLFFEKTIFNGMAEFRYVNNLPINLATQIHAPITNLSAIKSTNLGGRLVLNGGGKDGLTSALLLKEASLDFDLFQIGTGKAQLGTANALNKSPFVLKRAMEPRRLDARYSGHRPTSAAIAISAVLSARILNKAEVIASNENSSNEPNLSVDGYEINHQYTKSYEFESDFQTLLAQHNIGVTYFSLLRPLHELQIVKIFSKHPEYATSFISCNHGFRKGFWCMKCAKCAFMVLAITAISPDLADKVFGDNSINTPDLTQHLVELVNPLTIKPLECVGTLHECRLAAKIISKNPEVTLNETLSNAFIATSDHIPNETGLSRTLESEHSIDMSRYNAVLDLMKKYLNDPS